MDAQTLIERVVVVAVLLLVAFPFHEAAHAYAAFRLGDSTARLFGRMSLDPIVHFDLIGGGLLALSVILGGVGFGWAKPTPVNPYNLRGRYGEAIVAAAGPISNLILALIGGAIFRLVDTVGLSSDYVYVILANFVVINIVLMIFNFLPIPPLDGSKVLYAVLDQRTAMQVRPILDQYGLLVLIVLILFPLFNGLTFLDLVYTSVITPLANLFLGL